MQAKHVVSGELLFVYSDAANNFLTGTSQLVPNTLYNCRRFTAGSVGYQSVQLYGMELQAL